jgi:hypothetical protein
MKVIRSLVIVGLLAVSQVIHAQQWVQWQTTAGGNGHWYKAVINTNNLNWSQVDQLARNEGGYLATITSQAENDFVFSLINSPEFFSGIGGNGSGPAIGGYQPDGEPDANTGWRWETGEAWSFTNWAPGQPDSEVETRLEFWSGSQSVPAPTWNNLTPDDTNLGGYIIEREEKPIPAPSGFFGQAFTGRSGDSIVTPVLGTPVQAFVSAYDSNGKVVSRISSNPVGQFYSFIKPGDYTLIGNLTKQTPPPRNLSQATNNAAGWVMLQITVNTNQLTPVELDF